MLGVQRGSPNLTSSKAPVSKRRLTPRRHKVNARSRARREGKRAEKRARSADAEARAEERARSAGTLRYRLRAVTSSKRLRWCGVKKCADGFGVVVAGHGKGRTAAALGLMTCNSVHVCPVCARKLRTRRMVQLTRALRGGLQEYPKKAWVMLTATVRHHAGMGLRWLRDGLMKAWRRCRQQRAVKNIHARHVVATARAFEVTHSYENGWHPHLHVALLTSEWSPDELATLERVWSDCVVHAFTHARVTKARPYVTLDERRAALETRPNAEHGLRWSERRLTAGDSSTDLEAYLTDIGLELSTSAVTKTARMTRSRGPWQIAEAAVSGDERSLRLWLEYEAGTKGTRCLELDDRAAAMALLSPPDLPDDAQQGEADGADQVAEDVSFEDAERVGVDAVRVELDCAFLFVVRKYEALDPMATRLWLAAARADGPLTESAVRERIQAVVDAMVAALDKLEGRSHASHAHVSVTPAPLPPMPETLDAPDPFPF